MRTDQGEIVGYTGICINHAYKGDTNSPTFTYDNIRVTAVGYELFREDFASYNYCYMYDFWRTAPYGKTIEECLEGKIPTLPYKPY